MKKEEHDEKGKPQRPHGSVGELAIGSTKQQTARRKGEKRAQGLKEVAQSSEEEGSWLERTWTLPWAPVGGNGSVLNGVLRNSGSFRLARSGIDDCVAGNTESEMSLRMIELHCVNPLQLMTELPLIKAIRISRNRNNSSNTSPLTRTNACCTVHGARSRAASFSVQELIGPLDNLADPSRHMKNVPKQVR